MLFKLAVNSKQDMPKIPDFPHVVVVFLLIIPNTHYSTVDEKANTHKKRLIYFQLTAPFKNPLGATPLNSVPISHILYVS